MIRLMTAKGAHEFPDTAAACRWLDVYQPTAAALVLEDGQELYLDEHLRGAIWTEERARDAIREAIFAHVRWQTSQPFDVGDLRTMRIDWMRAGDFARVAVCDRALDGEAEALLACADVAIEAHRTRSRR